MLVLMNSTNALLISTLLNFNNKEDKVEIDLFLIVNLLDFNNNWINLLKTTSVSSSLKLLENFKMISFKISK